MDFLTGGKFKGTIHRVVQPPEDQRSYTRLGVFYFCMTDDDVRLSSLLQKHLIKEKVKGQKGGDLSKSESQDQDQDAVNPNAPTMRDWRRARTAAYGRSDLTKTKESASVEEEVFHGIAVKHYS